MRTVYDAMREHDRYEDMDEFDKFLVDKYEAEKQQEGPISTRRRWR